MSKDSECLMLEFGKNLAVILCITDLFDESLIILRHHLNWHLEDLVYFSLNKRQKTSSHSKMVPLSNSEEKLYDMLIREHLHADYVIYDHFRRKLENKIDELGKSIVDKDAKRLRKLIRRQRKQCNEEKSLGRNENHPQLNTSKAVKNAGSSTLIQETCEKLHRNDPKWVSLLRKRLNI